MEIFEALTIDAANLSQPLTIDAQLQSRVINITASTGDFELSGLRLAAGRTTGDYVGPLANGFSGGAICFASNGNLVGSAIGAGVVDALLGPLGDNGGDTATHALLIGSPAIDAGDPSVIFWFFRSAWRPLRSRVWRAHRYGRV